MPLGFQIFLSCFSHWGVAAEGCGQGETESGEEGERQVEGGATLVCNSVLWKAEIRPNNIERN